MGDFKSYTPTDKISLKNKRYHVFLSFCGKDTRENLVAHLFETLSAAGVHVFLDKKRIHMGENIGSRLKHAIEETDIHIPIFSRNYANSAWCLREVTEMSKSKGLVIPLFYGVEPADVKYAGERPVYRKAFETHASKGRETGETIQDWKDALFEVASRSGWSAQTLCGYEGKLVQRVVSDVLRTLNNVPLAVPKYAVGLKERMNAVINLLKMGDNDRVVTVGIWGAPGVGKSTLAMAIYNDIFRKFTAASFVYDVRAYGQQVDGLCKLQKQLLRDLLKWKSKESKINNVYHGKAILKEHLQSICGLVILDNVDNRKQLEMLGVEWLGKGSRVIVTTRDKSVLNVAEDEGNEGDVQVYAMRELGKEEALKLFSWHAFLKPCPDKEYKNLSEKIVNACGGLAFSLEVLGSSLNWRKDIRCWNEILVQLQSATFDGIYGMLKIIYQDLNAEEKQMFLDIACFFVGQDKEAAISFWEDLNLNPHINLSNLVLRSLVKIDYKPEATISMHDHLRDLGRAIVADESPDAAKRSRVWKPKDAYQVLHERPGFESVQSISVSGLAKSVSVLKAENLASAKNLKLIWLDNATIEGDLQPLSSNLRWFRWKSCPLGCLPSEWSMKHLVVLDLSSTTRAPSQIKQIWNEESKSPRNLKFLLLSGCVHLEVLPDLSNYTCLLRIDLQHCSGLREIPESIGLLLQLKCLNLCGCKDLEGLPEAIGELSSLKKFYLNGCSSIRNLPSTFSQLSALEQLDLGGLILIQELPPFQTDCALEKLFISGCRSLRSLPTSMCDLRRLSYLEMNECSTISDLPEKIGNLESLRELFMNECCRLEKLPESFGNLRNLKTLELKNARCLTGLPENFCKLESLVSFDASFSHLECLPTMMGGLLSLEILEMQDTFLKELPDSLSQIKKLKTLVLNQCDKLLELPALPEAIQKFEARGCKQIKRILNLSGLRNLTVMDLRNCQSLEELPVLCSSLAKLDIRGCINIGNLARLGSGRLINLQSLYSSGSDLIGLNLRQIVEDMPLFQKSSPEGMQYKVLLESSGFKDLVSFPVENNFKCEGVLLFFELEFNSRGIKNAPMEIAIVTDGEEIYRAISVTEGEEQFMLIFRTRHPVVVALEKAQNLSVRAKGEGIHIRAVEIRVSKEIQEEISDGRGEADFEGHRNQATKETRRDVDQDMFSQQGEMRQDDMVEQPYLEMVSTFEDDNEDVITKSYIAEVTRSSQREYLQHTDRINQQFRESIMQGQPTLTPLYKGALDTNKVRVMRVSPQVPPTPSHAAQERKVGDILEELDQTSDNKDTKFCSGDMIIGALPLEGRRL